MTKIVRGCFAGISSAFLEILEEYIDIRNLAPLTFDRIDKQDIASDKDLLSLIKVGYDFICVPLTLPNFNSLRLVELANLLDSPTLLILCSRTDADWSALSSIYDLCLRPHTLHREVEVLLCNPNSSRERDRLKVYSAFERILATAACFKIGVDAHGKGGRQVTIADYVASLEEKSVAVKYDVFVSHAKYDLQLAEELRNDLEKLGLRCFLAAQDVSSGSDWNEEIRQALISSNKVILLLTQRSVNRPWILIEAGAAWVLKKEIVPVLNQVDPASLTEPISRFQACLAETTKQRRSLARSLAANQKKYRPK